MKAQTTLEFIGAFMFFAIAIVGVITLTVDEIPQFHSYADTTEKNLELKSTTDLLLTTEGFHTSGGGGSDWENNPEYTDTPGLVSDEMHIDRGKLETLETVVQPGDEDEYYSYESMREDLDLEYEYNFYFTWFPIVETHRHFTRTRPPNGSAPNEPDIEEPADEDEEDKYNQADNRVHYGQIQLENTDLMFLVTAYDGYYNTTYVSTSWDFSDRNTYAEGEIPGELQNLGGHDFVIESIQNREDRPGSSIVLRTHLKEFGRNTETAEGNIEKINRYPVLDDPRSSNEIVRMEVLAW